MGAPLLSYYTRLGIEPTASREEIRRAFRAAVKRLPPTGAAEQWREVLEAYAVLRDPIARRRYDARCRGRAWGRQIVARFPARRGSSSRLRLMLWLGLAASCWAVHWMIAGGDRGRKRPLERRRLALPAVPDDREGAAVALLKAFGGDVRQLMATQAPPEELAQKLSALLVSYRSAAASHLRDLERVTRQMSQPCEDGELDALALMAIWGAQNEGTRLSRTQTDIPGSLDRMVVEGGNGDEADCSNSAGGRPRSAEYGNLGGVRLGRWHDGANRVRGR